MANTAISHNRVAYSGKSSFSQGGARNATTGDFVVNSPTGNNVEVVKFMRTSRYQYYQYYRAFAYFDLSSIPFTSINSLRVLFTSGESSGGNGDYIIVSSTAFSGNGSSNMVAGEYGSIDYANYYSLPMATLYGDGIISSSLNSNAITDAENDEFLIMSFINYDYDFLNTTAPPSTLENVYMNFNASVTITLDVDYNPSGPAGIGKWDGVQNSLIGNMNSVNYTDIDKINGV